MALDRRLVEEALPNYEVGGELGRGGWGIVLGARHRILDREVAVKQLPVAFGADPVVRARFKEEARLVAKLDHPHIAPVYDFVERDGMCLIVMEFLAGGTLWDRFRAHGVRIDEACAYILVAVSALEHSHSAGMIHRDIKPENFLFDDRPGVIKLSDFGIAKVLGADAANLTAAGQIVGTPAYMAPEQILGKPVGPATDVYACGTMLYELLSGVLPFPESDDPMDQILVKVREEPAPLLSHRADLPAAVAEVVDRSIRTDPADRYDTASSFGAALAEAATRELGVGWLQRSGVQLLASASLVSITERAVATPAQPVERPIIKATASHARLADLVAQAKAMDRPEEGAQAEAVAVAAAAAPEVAAATAPGPAPGGAPAPEPRAVPAEAEAALPGPGWFPDPLGRHHHRWWSGKGWTEHVADAGVTGVDPVG